VQPPFTDIPNVSPIWSRGFGVYLVWQSSDVQSTIPPTSSGASTVAYPGGSPTDTIPTSTGTAITNSESNLASSTFSVTQTPSTTSISLSSTLSSSAGGAGSNGGLSPTATAGITIGSLILTAASVFIGWKQYTIMKKDRKERKAQERRIELERLRGTGS
jgi:hypothetical protein